MSLSRRFRLPGVALALLASASIVAAAGAARAQGLAVGSRDQNRDDEGERRAPPRDARPGSLRGSLGVPVAQRLLGSDDADERLRGVVRLGAIGTPEAIDALVDALEQSSFVVRDPRARLTAIRVLGAYGDREGVRPVLIRELTEAGPEARGGLSPLGNLARGAAALSLARSTDKKARAALVSAVLSGGPAGEAATRALLAYPPASLDALLEGRRRLDPPLSALLGELGDLRAIERLRATLEDPDPNFRTAAALALARLGDDAPLGPARGWAKNEDLRQRRAGAEVLSRLGAKEAAAAIERMLGDEATRVDGVRLALLAPSPALAKPLIDALPSLPDEERGRAIAAIGRGGGPKAPELLLGLLAKPDLAMGAAFALATLPGTNARDALERALGSDSARTGAARRLMVRAGLVRALVLADVPRGLEDALAALRASKDAADRAVGVLGGVATGRMATEDAVDEACASGKTCDATLIGAAARGALARGVDALGELMPVLLRAARAADAAEKPDALAVAAGVALLADPRGTGLPTSLLARWAEGGSPLSPLAARALPSRDDESVRGVIKRLLAATDPVVRAHVALGLGLDPEADAVSLLASAYRFEEDASVRRAIVRALSQRKEAQRKATLETARDLDPDDGVRALARAALVRALDLPATVPSGSAAWVSLVANADEALPLLSGRAARLVRADGLCIPVLSDPDGVILVPGLPVGPSALALAPEPVPGDAPSP